MGQIPWLTEESPTDRQFWPLPRPLAEAHAFESCIRELLNRDPVSSPPGRCFHCGADEVIGRPLSRFDAKGDDPAWFHSDCWKIWHMARRAKAAAALTAIGIPLPAKRLWRHELDSAWMN